MEMVVSRDSSNRRLAISEVGAGNMVFDYSVKFVENGGKWWIENRNTAV